MSHLHSYLNSAKHILQLYKGEEPFSSFLKKFFNAEKKYGSKDRKTIGHLCYCFFRLGKSLPGLPAEERILIGLFLCSTESNEMLEQLKPEWNQSVTLSLDEKCSMLNDQCPMFNVFPWKEALSEGIDHEKFSGSFFIQPVVFLRLRKMHEPWVKEQLTNRKIDFKEIDEQAISIPAGTKIDAVPAFGYSFFVQDLSSQKLADSFKMAVAHAPLPFVSVWDCCAGSGGKSILLFDIHPQLDLVVSDIRESIISNLKKRFAVAGIKNYKAIVADVTKKTPAMIGQSKFDIIICDAPCTGSGTWSRTPEQLYFFDEKKIKDYSARQKQILSNAIPQLSDHGCLIYVTCSVFKKENEENVAFIKQQFNLKPVHMELLKGYDKKADSLFVVLLQKRN